MSKGFFESFKAGFAEFEKQFKGNEEKPNEAGETDSKEPEQKTNEEENILQQFLNSNNIDLNKLGAQVKDFAEKVKESEITKDFIKGFKENFTAEKLGAAFAEHMKAEAGMPQNYSATQNPSADQSAQTQGQQAAPAVNTENLDKALFGNWRWTDIYLSGGFSSVTDTYLTLYSNGYFTRTSRMVANNTSYDSEGNFEGITGFNSGLGDDEYGTWQSQGNTLALQYANGHISSKEYEAAHDCFILKSEYDKNQLWKRI